MARESEQPPAPAPTPESGPSHVVAIGASAGGLEALELFFGNMPDHSGLGFVVVQHLSPDYKSLMVELLSRKTTMKVLRAEDGMAVEADHVYLIPPKKNLSIFHGKLQLREQHRGSAINLPIDIFMKSLAEDQGERAVAVVLSGTGSDGMRGVRAVKEAGGMVMVQEPGTARFDGMPRSTLATGIVDFTLSPDQMPEQLLQFVQHPYAQASKGDSAALLPDEDDLSKILALLHHAVGVDFTCYKPSTIVRRIERRMSINQIWELADYIRYLESSQRELNTLYRELLIGVTSFFRDTDAYRALRENGIPEIFANAETQEPVRAWCAGCSTGEEAYSLAILLREEAERLRKPYDIKVFATDLDKDALEFAGVGLYPESIAADVSAERLARFFVRKGESYQISRQIREMVIFARHNLLKDPPFTKIDLLTCRNLLIYLQPTVQKKVFALFEFAVKPGGFLFLGTSETVGDQTNHFDPVDSRWKLYRSRGGSRAPLIHLLGTGIGRPKLPQSRKQAGGRAHLGEEERLLEPLYQALVDDYVPASVLVDENYEITRVFADVSDLVRFPVGRPTANLLKAVNSALTSPLTTALHKAGKSGKPVTYKNVTYRDGDVQHSIDLRVKPFRSRRTTECFYFVYFERPQTRPPPAETAEIVDGQDTSAERIADLERELQYTKENLQATIEELETSNEELQATNQELVSANEELQSTNEELQSVNEELYTVNAEYQGKIQELITLNNDMDNLLHSVSVGTLFLDSDLCVRKYTSKAESYVNVIDRDIGRPFEHLSHKLVYPGLSRDIEKVQETQEGLEREVRTEDGAWVLMIIAPYRQEQVPTSSGVVVTFVDITALKATQDALEQEQEHLELERQRHALALKAAQQGAWDWDVKSGSLTWSDKVEPIFGLEKGTFAGTYEAFLERVHPADRRHVETAVRNCVEDGTGYDIEHRIVWPDGSVHWVAETADVIRDADGSPLRMLGVVREVDIPDQGAPDRPSRTDEIFPADSREDAP